jgi:hypothetical protein
MRGHAEPLEDIAASAGWLELGTRLDAAMEAHAAYGLPRPEDVLKEVASLRGQTSVSVRDAVLAARYARKHFADRLRDDPDFRIGVSNVKQLALLGDIEGSEVDALRQSVLDGRISFRALAKEVDRIRESAVLNPQLDVEPRGRLQTFKQSRKFENSFQAFIEDVYIPSQRAILTIRKVTKLGYIPVDFIIFDEGQAAIAIEVKASPREAMHERMLIEELGLSVLARQKVPEVWFVTHADLKDQTERIEAVSASLGITGIRFMTFDPGVASKGDAAALEEIRLTSHERLDRLQQR